jgi:hypothetical protein
MICRVCGDEKESKEFYRIKHFYRYNHSHVKWCRACQKMFVDMKKQEEILKLREETKGTFVVNFQ